MTQQITARQKALEAILLTASTRDDFELSDDAWKDLVSVAWNGQLVQNRNHLRNNLLEVISAEIPAEGKQE